MKWTGRPPKFQDPKELEEAIGKYFMDCDKNKEPYTVTGLALVLGITPRKLREYKDCTEDINILKQLDSSVKKELSDIVKRAYLFCENYAERKLIDSGCNKSPAGYIFALKNFGWQDKQEIVQTTNNKADLSGLTTEQIQELLKEDK